MSRAGALAGPRLATCLVLCAALVGTLVPPVAAVKPLLRAAAAFDFNGDGYADLAAGDPSHAVTVVYGSKRGLSSNHTQRLTARSPGLAGRLPDRTGLGLSVASADFNFDSYADLVTTAGNRVVVVHGGPSGLTSNATIFSDRRLEIDDPEGDPIALATGDLNGDLYPDLVVGAPGGEDSSGAVAVVPGSPFGVDVDAIDVLSRDTAGVKKGFPEDGYGSAVAVGDFTDDGHDDLIVTSPQAVQGQFHNREPSGSIYLFPGSFDPGESGRVELGPATVLSADTVLDGREWFSITVETRLVVGEFTGDGRADLAVGGSERCSRLYSELGCEQVFIFHGGRKAIGPVNMETWNRAALGPAAGTGDGAFGRTLAAGDLDRDGHDELVVGAPYQQVGPDRDAGAVYVIYGTPDGLSPTRFQLLTQANPGIKSVARPSEELGGGFLRILDFGKGRDRDLAIHSPNDQYTHRDGMPTSGTINVLYTRGDRVSETDQLWYADSAGLTASERRSGGFSGRCC